MSEIIQFKTMALISKLYSPVYIQLLS